MAEVATYKSVRDRANLLLTGKTEATTADAAALNVFINDFGREFWDRYFWPEWTLVEKRQFRADWNSGTTYGAPSATVPVEVYYPPAKAYYQSLRGANLNNQPATGADLEENSAWWAVSEVDYSGDDWAASTVYVVGDRVLRADDQRYYQCHTAHTSGASFDTTKFGILTEFTRDIDYAQTLAGTAQTVIGAVKEVWDQNPETHPESACAINKTLMRTGVIVWGGQPVVYVEFRQRAPSWTGNTWASGTSYVAADQVYYTVTGDYYVNIQATSSELPTNTSFWTKIEFPLVLKDATAQAAYAMMLKATGKTSKWEVELAEAHRLLRRQFDKLERQQGQTEQLNVMMRA